MSRVERGEMLSEMFIRKKYLAHTQLNINDILNALVSFLKYVKVYGWFLWNMVTLEKKNN